MRRKKLISPEQSVTDPIEYRYKLLFLPYLSYAISATVLGTFVGILLTFIILESTSIAILISTSFFLFLLLLELLVVWFAVKKTDLMMTAENISAVDIWYRRRSIGWQEITFLQHRHLFGIRYLYIKTADDKSAIILTRFYQTDRLLDRIRELAGAEHILVRALEKELSRPRRELTKVWGWVIGSIAVTMSIYLIGGNTYAAEREKPLQQAIATHISQYPPTAPNQSAIELQALMTKLGISVNVFGDGSKVKTIPTTAAIDEWGKIQTELYTFVNEQLAKTEDSIDPIPGKIATYIKNHQADLDAISTHLANNQTPEWGNDTWLSQRDPKADDSPLFSQLPNFLSINNLKNLAIANLLDKQQQPNADFTKDLITIKKLQQSTHPQQSLVGQLTSVVGGNNISKLVRRIDSPQPKLNDRLPKGWGDNLFGKERHRYMMGAIENESIGTNKFLINPALLDRLFVLYDNPLRFIPGLSTILQPRFRLIAVDRHQEISKGVDYWSKQNICRTDGNSGVKSNISTIEYTIDPVLLTNQYSKVLKQDLLWELTTSVRQVKAKLAAGKKVDLVAKDFNFQSKVCPGEQWTATSANGSVNITFSHPPNWNALGIRNAKASESLTYSVKSIAKT